MIKIKKAEVTATVVRRDQYPPELSLDIVLAGRSNVGKSSLINRLINRRGLARTSSSPGKTRTLNFYGINDTWYFVDLPGYGYAKVSHAEQNNFKKMVDSYLTSGRRMMVWQIIDLRHPPSALDHQMSEYLKASGLPYLTVATKADKLSKNEIAKNKAMVKRELGLTEDELVVFSAQSGLNKEVLLARIETLIGEARLLSEKRITEGEGL